MAVDTEIPRVRAALRRHEAKVDAMANQCRPGDCCPSCMFGSEYREAVEQYERTRQWLTVLLEKRGRLEDVAEARRLRLE